MALAFCLFSPLRGVFRLLEQWGGMAALAGLTGYEETKNEDNNGVGLFLLRAPCPRMSVFLKTHLAC